MSRYSLENMEAILEGLEEKRNEAKENGEWDKVKRIDDQIKEIEKEMENLKEFYGL